MRPNTEAFDLTLSGPAQRWAFCIFARLAVKALCPFGRRTVVAPLCTPSGDKGGRAFGAFVTLVGFSGSPGALLCLPFLEGGDNSDTRAGQERRFLALLPFSPSSTSPHTCVSPLSPSGIQRGVWSDTNSFALSCGTNLPKLAQLAGARVNDPLAPGCKPCGIHPRSGGRSCPGFPFGLLSSPRSEETRTQESPMWFWWQSWFDWWLPPSRPRHEVVTVDFDRKRVIDRLAS